MINIQPGRVVESLDHLRIDRAAYHRWYGLKAWQDARYVQLARQPLCERCLQSETITEATVVNHRIPHRGDWQLFIEPNNHESVCAPHHDGLIQREEKRGHVIGCDIDGRPLDPEHPWNRPEGVGDELWPSGRRTRAPGAFAARAISKRGDVRHPRRG